MKNLVKMVKESEKFAKTAKEILGADEAFANHPILSQFLPDEYKTSKMMVETYIDREAIPQLIRENHLMDIEEGGLAFSNLLAERDKIFRELNDSEAKGWYEFYIEEEKISTFGEFVAIHCR